MTRDDIIRMYEKANGWSPAAYAITLEELERFAVLVAAAEREACADTVWPKLKVWSEEELTAMTLAFNRAQQKHGWYETLMAVGAAALKNRAAAIRARGQK